MANYDCVIRTNYFHVKDDEAFRNLMARVYNGNELEPIEVWEKKDDEGNLVFGFGSYSGISGLRDPKDEDNSYGEFIDELQKCVADDDAILITEIGSEKMRYLVAQTEIVTSKEYTCVDLMQEAKCLAAELLGYAVWNTEYEY